MAAEKKGRGRISGNSRSGRAAFAGIPGSRRVRLVHFEEEVRAISTAIRMAVSPRRASFRPDHTALPRPSNRTSR